jgi:RNA polymerase sigma factor (sigma-70 family)
MASAQMQALGRHDAMERTQEVADENLVEQFLRGDEIDSEDAFRALVERHGPMVLGVCRFVLGQDADAEDAFQATFLTLARKGASIQNRAILAAWLHEVAYRTAIKVRVKAVRRRTVERQSVSMMPSEFEPDSQHHDAAWSELRPLLHDEVRGLPEKYRVPIILSYLEGKTNEEVAQLLHWPVGTVKGRLSRARTLLRSRLMRRGLTLSAAFLLTALADGAVFAEVVPPELVRRTLRFVKRFNTPPTTPRSEPSAGQSPTDSTFPSRHGSLIDLLRKPPKFMLVSLAVLASLLSVYAAIGLGATFAGSGNLSYFRSGGLAGSSAHATTANLPTGERPPAAPCH